MKKRGATIKHKAASMPGALALAVCPEYETRLRLAVNALSDGWMEEGQFNDLADTIDMLQIGMASYSRQKPDPSTAVAIDVCREAMMSIRERYIKTGKFGATGEELKATRLLADVSLDFWRRRSGALFAFSVQQLKELRADQRDEAKQLKEETQAMNARDSATSLPAIDGIINAAHKALAESKAPLCSEDVAKAINGTKRVTKAQIKEAEKQLKELYGLGILESQTRTGGVSFYSLTVAPAQEAKTGIPVVESNQDVADVSLIDEGKTAEVCGLVQTGGESQAEDSPISDEVRAQIQRLNTVTPDEFSLLNVIADIRAAIGDPEGKIMLGDLAAHIQRDIGELIESLEVEKRVSGSAISAMAHICEHLGCDDHNGHVPVLRAIDDLRAQIASLTADVMRTRGSLNSAINEADRLRSELAIERQARQALQEKVNAAPVPAHKGYVLKTPKRAMRRFGEEAAAQSAAMAVARAGRTGEVFALVPVGKAVRGAEWKVAS